MWDSIIADLILYDNIKSAAYWAWSYKILYFQVI